MHPDKGVRPSAEDPLPPMPRAPTPVRGLQLADEVDPAANRHLLLLRHPTGEDRKLPLIPMGDILIPLSVAKVDPDRGDVTIVPSEVDTWGS